MRREIDFICISFVCALILLPAIPFPYDGSRRRMMILISQKTDEKILLAIQRWRVPPLTWTLRCFTWTGKGAFWVFVATAINVANHFVLIVNPYFAKAFYAPLIVWAINWVVKRKVRRDRPPVANKNIIPLTQTPPCYSFPSSHAGSTFSFFFILVWWKFPEAVWFGCWAAVVSFSRMYLGVHYLTDVIGGILIGLIASGITYLIF